MHSPTLTLRHGLFIAAALALVAMAGTSYTQHVDAIFTDGFEPIPNRPPVADAGLDQSATTGMPLSLDGSNSYDPDGDPLIYLWQISERPLGSGADLFEPTAIAPTLIPDRAGEYVLTLVVSDGEFTSAPDSVVVTVTGALSSSATIGAGGGAVGLPDGASVLIPPAALDSSVVISIAQIAEPPGSTLPPTAASVGNIYQLSPSGQVFNVPVQIIVPYDPALLPPGYSEGAITIHRQSGTSAFHMVGSETDDVETESHAQDIDIENHQVLVRSLSFSSYRALSIQRSSQFTPLTLTEPTASIEVRRPPNLRTERPQYFNCSLNGNFNGNQIPLMQRTGNVEGIVVHSTNNGRPTYDFESELGWAADDCNPYFAHYYIDRSGVIFQVVDDLLVSQHVGPGNFGLSNSTAIGVELFNNVGEPFDGRQLAALARLVDFLMEKYALDRPQRSATTGALVRNRVQVSQGGDRVVSHEELVATKCDPSGTYLSSAEIKEERVNIRQCRDPTLYHPITGGNAQAPALMDMLLDHISVLGRDRQHTGMINTQGGDAFELGTAGNGGAVSLSEDSALVATNVGSAERLDWEENDSQQLGPGPLIVAFGGNATLAAGAHTYTDVLVDGTLNLAGPTQFNLTGSFYLSPRGVIIIRDGANGGDLTVYSRGTPLIQGLIDARGSDGISGTPNGGNGGRVSIVYAFPGVLPVPTVYTRGGDADDADTTATGGGPRGGKGGDVSISLGGTHAFFGGGIGPVIGNVSVPAWRSGNIDPALLDPPFRWAGDFLPVPPPFTLSSLGVSPPVTGERVRKWTSVAQPGFKRGILTTGGMGGWGGSTSGNQHGGSAGAGGDVQINVNATGTLTFRDVDLITGGEIETLTHRFYLPPPAASTQRLVCTAAGAQGGFGRNVGSRGGDGGPGGAAGNITRNGGALDPAPTQFAGIYEIRGFPAGARLLEADDSCSRGSVAVGNVVEARNATGDPLYRLRLTSAGTALLGGLGGIPSGRSTAGYPGDVGPYGANGTLSGLPTQ